MAPRSPAAQAKKRSLTLDQWVERMERNPRDRPCLSVVRRIAAREPAWGELPESLPAALRRALVRRGIRRPYTHQSDAWNAVGAGRSVVVVTPTASGKSLCYNVPIVSMLLEERDGTALFLYPTKALAQDQCAELNALLKECEVETPSQVYDGDTPAEIRRTVRESTRAVMTNPDMLHASILPHHDKWRRLFSTLRYIVVDEMHTYTGVFGSHVANVLRRLRRICAHYGANPQVLFTSATIANPQELAARLCGGEVDLVNRNGAPSGERIFVIYNPPYLDVELQRRMAASSAAIGLASQLVQNGYGTIVFARSRQGVERVTRGLKTSLERKRLNELSARVTGYRGGYLPEDRRKIEKGLRNGDLAAVISTNALELGIDIGSLDVCIIAGYPGTIASTWQQAGRAGRRQDVSLSVLVTSDDPVDQYLALHPDYFFGSTPEHGRIDPDNLRILADHLRCAAYELPIGADEAWGDLSVDETHDVLQYLSEEGGLLQMGPDGWRMSGEDYPAAEISLRDMYDENVVIIDVTHKPEKILGEIDFFDAHVTVYENAIYQHHAQLYEVQRFDWHERKAYVRAAEVDYYTTAIDQTKVFVLDVEEETAARVDHGWGDVRIITRFVGYKKLRFKTSENIGYGPIKLPDIERHTTSYWATFPSEHLETLKLDQEALAGAMSGIGRVMHTVAIVHLMCATGDLLVTVGSGMAESRQAQPLVSGEARPAAADARVGNTVELVPIASGSAIDDPTIYLYDSIPGGVGFSEKLFTLHDELLRRSLELVRDCTCEHGCPACVGPPQLVSPRGKAAAMRILQSVTT